MGSGSSRTTIWTHWVASPNALPAIRAEQARRRLIDFTTYTYPQYTPGPVHRLIAGQLEAVERGECERLMLFCPPRTGKTELLLRWIAWTLGRHPDWPLIFASYGADLAWEKSAEARNIVGGEEFAEVFGSTATKETAGRGGPVGLDRGSRSASRWRIAGRRGGLVAQGVGGPITGKGGKIVVVDDPVKNREEADSPTIRERVWQWYTSTLRTRLEPGGRMVLVMTRWHEDDLAGRLLGLAASDAAADQWRVVSLPALAEDAGDPLGRQVGEALDPQRYDAAALARIRASIGSRDWAALYQQRPAPLAGGLFKRQWLGIVEAGPAVARRVRYWDKAGTSGGGDYSAGVRVAVTPDGLWFVEDVVRGQWSALARNQVMLQTAQLDGPQVAIWLEQEPGSGGKESAELSVRQLAGFGVRAEPVTGDKLVRAQPLAAQCEAGNVRLVRGAWNAAYIDELCVFPNGEHDDQVDASSGAFNKLARPGGLWIA